MSRIRLLTCNLFNGRADPGALAGVLGDAAPDIVAAQELGPNAAQVLADALPHGRLEPSLAFRGIGIALRHQAAVSPFGLPARDGLVAQLEPATWPGLPRPFQIVNVHLTNPIQRPWRVTRRTRRDQIAAIVGHVARATVPLTIVGDLNATPWWPAYRRLIRVTRDGIHDTGTTRRTWGPWAWSPRMLRIDHVLVRGGVRVLSAETVRIRGSDHSAVIADLELD